MTVNEQLVGKKFKRITKHGISTFIGIITEVIVVFKNYSKPFKYEIPHIKVKSENGLVYSLNEIVLI